MSGGKFPVAFFRQAGDIQCLDLALANPLQNLCKHIRHNAMIALDDEGRLFQALSEHLGCRCSAIEFPAIDDQSAMFCADLSNRDDMPAESNWLGDSTGQ